MNKGNIIFGVLGLVAIASGILVYMEGSAFQKRAKVAIGVAEFGIRPKVRYKTDTGEERVYQSSSSKGNKFHTGDKVKVFYLEDEPGKARVTDGRKGGKKIIVVGCVMLLFNIYLIVTGKAREKSLKMMKENGRKMQAEIISVETDTTIKIRGKNPYKINCKWTDTFTGKEYTHAIKHIWADPAPLLAGRKYLDVYIDPSAPDKYYVDTEFLSSLLPV